MQSGTVTKFSPIYILVLHETLYHNTNIFQINFQSLYSIQKFNKNEIGKASIVNHTLSICHRQIKFGHDNKN